MKLFNYLKGDKVIWAIMLLLSLISILVVYSSIVTLAYKFKQGNTEYYLYKHVVIIALGFGLAYLFHKIKYTVFSKVAQIGFLLSIPLLVYTLLSGVSEGEANRWLPIPGIGLTFQTSDIAKLMLLMYIARVLTTKQEQLVEFKAVLKYLLLPIGIVCALILPANFSTAALLFLNCIFLMFIGRIKLKFMIYIIGACMVFSLLLGVVVYQFPNAIPRGTTWKARIENFSKGDSKSNYQSEQAKIAIATGGVIGKGPGKSIQRAFLPQASSDFIYAIIIEEYGLALGFLMLFLYMIFLYRGIKIMRDTDKTFGGYLASGLTFSLVFQALINMAVAVNLFPVTGQPLPLVSMGGTSIWFTCIAIGIILSVSRSGEDKTEENLESA
ncbi:MAG TPA: FtsW/RodA/SpoVE family cell cycle protein [Bacteroidia bacterium]|jgi:cell division protein FtsW|nr:FtsW/RodA/SpoVE family cell cycle protein [Bacteroidia bacterium]